MSRGAICCGGDAEDGCDDECGEVALTTPEMSLMSDAAFVVVDVMY